MIGSAMIIHADDRGPELSPMAKPPKLDFMQKVVGGYIEQVPYFNTMVLDDEGTTVPCVVFCNEEGKLNGLPFNRVATAMWHQALLRLRGEDGELLYPTGLRAPDGSLSDVLVGSILVLVGDPEFLRAL